MADPWDVPPKPADLPDPELNPLMNPTLGKNLGRWAQVYFTSSPETREQAVGQLLRELERGEPVGAYPANDGEPTQKREAYASSVICPRCNERNSVDQNFCGICGTRIPAVAQEPQPSKLVPAQEIRESQWTPSPSSSGETAWLRDKVFTADEEPQHSSRKAWIFAIIALLLILGGAAYLQYAPDKRASTPSPVAAPGDSDSAVPAASQPASNAPAPTPAPPAVTADTQPTPAAAAQPSTPEPTAPAKAESRAAGHESATAVARKTPPNPAPRHAVAPVPAADDGSRELAEAQRLLSGAGTSRNPEVAAALLWKSVKKENASAEVQLAELYAQGQGVGKNCEQARLLLTAAAKRGASDAAQKLRQIQSGGCQ